MKPALPFALILLALSACGSSEPETAANRFARTENEIAAREKALTSEVANELSQTEQRLDAEASQALNSLNATATANAAEEGAPAAAAGNKARQR
jgi:hypothetical protein